MQNVLIFKNEEIAADFLALIFSATIAARNAKHETANLGFATGVTPIRMYQKLIAINQGKYQIAKAQFLKLKIIAKKLLNLDFNFLTELDLKSNELFSFKPLSWSQVQTFNLDEFVGLDQKHPERFSTYMHQLLFNKLDLKPELINFPNPDCKDLQVACQDYETKIGKVNVNLCQLITLGINGHMAYNEPGTALNSTTHVVLLSNATRENLVKQHKFPDLITTPTQAITVGIQTILKMQQVIMVALGESKAIMTQKMLEEPVNELVTASALQNHPNCLYVVDQAAAKLLKSTNQKYHLIYF